MKQAGRQEAMARVRSFAIVSLAATSFALACVGIRAEPVTPVPAAAPLDTSNAFHGADDAVQAAHAAVADGDFDRIASLAPAVAGTLLEPYMDYWLASVRLHATPPDDSLVPPFLAKYAGTAIADRLRYDWLIALGNKGDFATFQEERKHLVWATEDPQVACYTLLARYTLDDGKHREHIAREARRNLASSSDPGSDGCAALANRLLDDEAMSIWPRLQALAERNQVPAAEKAALRLPEAQQHAIKKALEQPGAWLAGMMAHPETTPRQISLLAIVMLARDMPDQAAGYAQDMLPPLTTEERAIIWGRIGRMAEYALLPQAHEWFERGGPMVAAGVDYVRPNDVLEARARAALRIGAYSWPAPPEGDHAGTDPDHSNAQVPGATAAPPGTAQARNQSIGPDWAALRRVIAQMPADMQQDSTWVFWNAQALIAEGRNEEGRAALQSIAGRFNFYGRLAAEQLDLPGALPGQAEAPPSALVDELAKRPGFQRARKLLELGLREEGNREWAWELRGMDDASLHAAAELGRQFGLLDRMIMASERMHAGVDIGQRYPMPYPELMTTTTAPLGMNPAWIYGLIRQESRFMEDVRSNAGAVGLMQLMPQTARYIAHRIGYENYRADRIADVNVNLRLGTEYLKLIFDDQDDQPLLASAAYNCGPNRVRKWRAGLARPLDGAIFLETIPINETRDYTKRVLFNTVVYGSLLGQQAVTLQSLLGTVAPKAVPTTELP